MAPVKPLADIAICALSWTFVALQQDKNCAAHLIAHGVGKLTVVSGDAGQRSSVICAVHYSGPLDGAAENDFFATDENLIELR